MSAIVTWDGDGMKITVLVPLGNWVFVDPATGVTETVTFPVSSLVGKTIAAKIGKIASDGTPSGVQAVTPSTSEAAPTAADLSAITYKGKLAQSGDLAGRITGLWSAAQVPYGKGQRVQFVITVAGDKLYTVFDQPFDALASL